MPFSKGQSGNPSGRPRGSKAMVSARLTARQLAHYAPLQPQINRIIESTLATAERYPADA